MKWFFLLFAMAVNAAASILMKLGARHAEHHPLGDSATLLDKTFHFLNAWTIVAIFLFAVNVLAYRKALDEMSLNIAYPIMVSGGLVIVTAAAWLIPLISERLYWWQIVGLVLIALGVWLLVYDPARATSAP